MHRADFHVTFDADFSAVVEACAAREETWINDTIRHLYLALHMRGHAHSVEVWHGELLSGGAYGVSIGGAFFGESMFSRVRDASKIALAYLVDRLAATGFTLLDTQFPTDHLRSLGVVEISRGEYKLRLSEALDLAVDFNGVVGVPEPPVVVARLRSASFEP
jgi:leucyl/phenylalanyl-tRNA--protein transferase